MEVIINLIIIFIIVGSVIKKFQELSKSGEKIQKPRTEPEPSYGETVSETVTAEESYETSGEEYAPVYREEIPEQKPPLSSHTRTLDEILEQMKAEMPKEESIYTTQREIVSDSTQGSIYRAPKEITADSRQEGAYSKRKPSEEFPYGRKPGVMPQFGYNAVVNGLVMSEILGRPVSMRRANDWW